jgi:hypothetical protein
MYLFTKVMKRKAWCMTKIVCIYTVVYYTQYYTGKAYTTMPQSMPVCVFAHRVDTCLENVPQIL